MGKYLDLARRVDDMDSSNPAVDTDSPDPAVATEPGYELNELNEISPLLGREAAPLVDPQGWDAETQRLVDWFSTTTPPAEPFELCQGVTILDPTRWWRSIEGDIGCGPTGPRARYGAVQGDLRKLYKLMKTAGGIPL